MKMLYFDLEHGSQSLGSKKDVESIFGYPCLEPKSWDQFQSTIGKIYTQKSNSVDGKMKLQGWGQLKNKLDTALEFISRVPGVVICNCHSKVQSMDEGNKVIPYIDGSTKEDISKWFDFVLYTKTIKKSSGEREWVWITKRCETYDHAKDRTNLLPAQIPQDYQLILDAANKKGFDGCKILVVGAPGSGKTMSLQTLNNKGGVNENTND